MTIKESRRTVALLLSGGGGRRLWPASTDDAPKQFLRLFDERSLFQKTLARLATVGIADIVIVANTRHEALVRRQTAETGAAAPLLLLEPMRRDSAAAIAAGVEAIIARHGGDALVAVLPCDHLIPDAAHFAKALGEAAELAALDRLVTFGIRPTFPSTEFGYIQRGAAIQNHPNGYAVAQFHEKPNRDVAARYLASGDYFWNSGMFVFRAGEFVREANAHMPDISTAATNAVRHGRAEGDRIVLDEPAFAAARRASIDIALFEKSERVGVVPVSFPWSDVGTWRSVYEAHQKDSAGNALVGNVLACEASNTLVISEGVKVVVVGVDELVVIASPQGVFVAPRSRASEVKDIIGD